MIEVFTCWECGKPLEPGSKSVVCPSCDRKNGDGKEAEGEQECKD